MTNLRKSVSVLLLMLFVSQLALPQATGTQTTESREDVAKLLLNLKIESMNLQTQLENSKKRIAELEAQIRESQTQIQNSQENSSNLTQISEEQKTLIDEQLTNLESLELQLMKQMSQAEELQNTYDNLKASITSLEREIKVYRAVAVVTISVGVGAMATYFLLKMK